MFDSRITKEPVFYIQPERLKFVANMAQYICDTYGVELRTPEFKLARHQVREIGHCSGNWDINQWLFKKEPFFEVLAMWDAGRNFQQTKAFATAVWKYGRQKAVAVFDRWRALYDDMRVNGYRTAGDGNPWNQYILACVGRDGELLFYQGRHRLSMALHLGIEKVPVKVGLRHTEWHQFREAVKQYASTHNGRTYAPLDHPDFTGMDHKWSDYRADVVLNHISPESWHVLDIGAHWGYMSARLAQTGRVCNAVEKSPGMFYFMDKINAMNGHLFTAYQMGINEFLQETGWVKFDCVLALNIFHHFLKDKAGWRNLVKVAETIQCKEMFFQMANDRTLGKFGNGWKKTADVLELFQSKAGLPVVNEIGREHNRTIYHLQKA